MIRTRLAIPAALSLATCALAACGGKVILPPDGGGDSTATTTTTTSSSGTVTLTGPSCVASSDCAGVEVCIFSSGTCALACTISQPWSTEPCPTGLVCGACVTGSCQGCLDCISACVPAAPGHCDDHDDCAAGEVCVYESGTCAPGCGEPGQPACAAGLTCAQWATAACPICQQAIGACLPP
jgi:hypothetical protein